MFEIIANLIDNGIRYNRRGGVVTVLLSRDADHVRLTVSDDGPGIAPEYHDRIFERFFRAVGPNGAEGTGLGLAIVQSAASRMDARVTIAPGGPGTRICVIFDSLTG